MLITAAPGILVASNNFLSEPAFQDDLATWGYSIEEVYGYINLTDSYPRLRETQLFFAQHSTDSDSVQRMEPADCAAAYAGGLVSDYSDVLVIATDHSSNRSAGFLAFTTGSSGNWVCGGIFPDWRSFFPPSECDTSKTWNVTIWQKELQVDHCLLRRTPQRSRLQLSILFLAVVVVCNLIKGATMLWTAFGPKTAPLVTVGDALSSFLQSSDNKEPVRERSLNIAGGGKWNCLSRRFSTAYKKLWFYSASATAWAFTIGFCLSGIRSAAYRGLEPQFGLPCNGFRKRIRHSGQRHASLQCTQPTSAQQRSARARIGSVTCQQPPGYLQLFVLHVQCSVLNASARL